MTRFIKTITEVKLGFAPGTDSGPVTGSIADKVAMSTCLPFCEVTAQIYKGKLYLTIRTQVQTDGNNLKMLRDIREATCERVQNVWPGAIVTKDYKVTMRNQHESN